MKAEQFSMNVILARSNSALDAGRMHVLGGFSIPLRFERMGIGEATTRVRNLECLNRQSEREGERDRAREKKRMTNHPKNKQNGRKWI